MNICAPATSNPSIDLNILDEINLNYTERHSQQDLIDFCTKFQEKRINVSYHESLEIASLIAASAMCNNNLYVRLAYKDIAKIVELDKYKIKYFIDYPIDSYLKLKWFLDCTSTTDIYISDDLCYNIPEVFEICKKRGVAIRMVLNKIPSTFEFATTLKEAPVFSPENFDYLNKYIATAEFDCWNGDKYLWNEYNVLYKRWFDKKSFVGDLSFINKDVNTNTVMTNINSEFIEARSSCKYRCAMKSDYPCSRCSRAANISDYYSK